MITIAQVRHRYPQYKDLSDSQLADALHKKYYSDIPKNKFMERIGISSSKVSSPHPNFIDRLGAFGKRAAKDALIGLHDTANVGRGIRDSVVNAASDVANLIPGVHLRQLHSADDGYYTAGKILGNVGSFIGGGEALDGVRGGAKALPYLGKAARLLEGEGLSGVARRAVGSGLYGGITNPDNRLGGFETGAALSGIGDLGGGIAKGVANASKVIRPVQQAKKILSFLGGGQSLENNAKSVAQDVRNAYKQRLGEANALYNPVLGALGPRSIYNSGLKPFYLNAIKNDPRFLKSYDTDLEDFHKQFESNPTFNNAHDLNRQLGSTIRSLENVEKSKGLDIAGRRDLQNLVKTKNLLKSDIDSFLFRADPQAKLKFDAANQHWADNVAPYKSNSKIFQMATGKVKNPKYLHNIFKNPEEDVLKVVDDLPESTRNKILFSYLGAPRNYGNPEALKNAFNNLDKVGLESYVTPRLQKEIDSLSRKMMSAKVAKVGVGGTLAGLATGQAGAPAIAEGIAALGGAYFTPGIMRFLQDVAPIERARSAIVKGSKKGYPIAVKSLLANIVPSH